MGRKICRSLFVLVFWAILLPSCVGEQAQVEKALEARRLGLEKRDIELYMSSISPRYGGKEGGAGILRQKALEMMDGFDSIRMHISSRQVTVSKLDAEAMQSYEVQVRRGDQVRELKGRERIGLRKEDGSWKIVSGL